MIDNLRKYSALTLCSALLLGVPPVIGGGAFFSFDQAQAAKGGNGNGKGRPAAARAATPADKVPARAAMPAARVPARAAMPGQGERHPDGKRRQEGRRRPQEQEDGGRPEGFDHVQGLKGCCKEAEVAATEDTAPSKKSALGRWNAVKPIDHPAVQAHIRNGNFNGTIGLNAAYVLAQD